MCFGSEEWVGYLQFEKTLQVVGCRDFLAPKGKSIRKLYIWLCMFAKARRKVQWKRYCNQAQPDEATGHETWNAAKFHICILSTKHA